MRKVAKVIAAGVTAAALALGVSACDHKGNADSEARNGAYDQMMKDQPGKTMKYSPTRETINYWVDKWDEPGKLSYVYLQNSEGKVLGYYVLKGLPVSYCAQISPNYSIHNPDSTGAVVVPAPANDGAYYSDGNCNTYYGQDATTGAYIEYTAGLGINVLLFDQPMPNENGVKPLGKTTVEDVKKK